jgi:hypothetical protein
LTWDLTGRLYRKHLSGAAGGRHDRRRAGPAAHLPVPCLLTTLSV